MYKSILIPLENSTVDRAILEHVRGLARMTGARLILMHVADGWVARNYNLLQLQESEEMKADRAYLEEQARILRAEGFQVEPMLALGDPAKEIIELAHKTGADLIAMSTHGHRFISDLLYGSTADKVRHCVDVPVLLLKARP